MPIGRLMKKHQCQLELSVIQPPSVGPSVGATMMPSRKIAWTIPCSSRGKIWRSVACAVESSAAPPAPWSSRQSTSSPSVVAVPHSNEATMNRMIENVR